jgi:hypothetical protein
MDCRRNREVAGEKADSQVVVPSKGLEPPHPCGYMDLNHARLPIPPRWQKISAADFTVRPAGKNCKSILQSEGKVSNRAYGAPLDRNQVSRSRPERPAARVGVLAFELGVHRDLGVQHLRDRAPGFGIVGCFLKGGRVGARHASDHIKMNRGNRPT